MDEYKLGIDQSFTCTGIVILKNNEMVHFEVIKTTKEDSRYKRALDISNKISEIISQYNVTIVNIEGLPFGMRAGNVTRDLAGLLFVIMAKLIENHNIEATVIAPRSVKLFATGSGKASKEEMVESLPKDVLNQFVILGFKKSNGLHDLTDAYWICKKE